MRRPDGKVALISGTARGQGRAAALETQRLIAKAGGTAITPDPLDVPLEDSVRAWVEEAVDAFGGVDILCANAGAVRFGAVDTQPYEDFTFTMRAELDSVWPAAHLAWPHLVRSRGSVLTVGSTAGLTGSLTNRRTAHSASKGAVIALTRRLAAEGSPHGIRANCISPGMIDTEATRGGLLADGHPMRTIARHIPSAASASLTRWSTPPSFSPPAKPRTSPAPTSLSTAAGRPYFPAQSTER